mgnify:CR=1 FL=1
MITANARRLPRKQAALALVIISIVLLMGSVTSALDNSTDDSPFYYISPRPNAEFVHPESSIVVRSDLIDAKDLLKADTFSVAGNLSGKHQGDTVLARDGRTVIFFPETPFKPDERVVVIIRYPVQPSQIGSVGEYTYTFNVTEPVIGTSTSDHLTEFQQAMDAVSVANFQNFKTAPPDIPALTVEQWPGGDLGDGYIFMSPFSIVKPGQSILDSQTLNYNLILDNNAEPIYYYRITTVLNSVDFKKQPNGLLTHSLLTDSGWGFVGLNINYQHVTDYTAGMNPITGEVEYTADHHDLQILDNGNFLILIHDSQIVDMSEFGRDKETVLKGCTVQEVDEDNFAVFQCSSWDEIPITDT